MNCRLASFIAHLSKRTEVTIKSAKRQPYSQIFTLRNEELRITDNSGSLT